MLHKSRIYIFKDFSFVIFGFYRVPLTKDQQIIEPDWEVYLRDTARMIGEQQTPQRYLLLSSPVLILFLYVHYFIVES